MFADDQAKIQDWLAGGANKTTGGAMPDYTGLGPDKIAQIAQLIASTKSCIVTSPGRRQTRPWPGRSIATAL